MKLACNLCRQALAFWRLSPERGRCWFTVALLAFYIWAPLDWYFIRCDLRFALGFSMAQPLSDGLKALFDARQAFGPAPLIQLLGYLAAITLAVFQPKLGKTS